MNCSLYIIKPEAMQLRAEIRNLIVDSGLHIVRAVEVIIPTSTLAALYINLSSDLLVATRLFMGREPCEIGEVSGDDAVNRLIRVCGHSIDPNQCDPQTIRGRFGVREAERVGAAFYFRNAIHRPKTEEEAQRDLMIFSPFLQRTV